MDVARDRVRHARRHSDEALADDLTQFERHQQGLTDRWARKMQVCASEYESLHRVIANNRSLRREWTKALVWLQGL